MKTILTVVYFMICTHFTMGALYQIVDLGILPGAESGSVTYGGINNNGDVIGYSFFPMSPSSPGGYSATLWRNGQIYNLGTFSSQDTYASSINNNGQILVSTFAESSGVTLVTYNSGLNIEASIPGYFNNSFRINDLGQVAGTHNVPEDNLSGSGFIWQGGMTIDIGNMAGGVYNQPTDINNLGFVVGTSYNATGFPSSSGYVYSNGSYQLITPPSGYNALWPSSINDIGDIVGSFGVVNSALSRAFLYQNGNLLPIGDSLSSAALDINNNGQVVGMANVNTSNSYSFIYENGLMQDIGNLIEPNSGWEILGVAGINDSGQITGLGINPRGQERVFLLNPIPEPSTLALLPFALIMFLRRRR